MKIDELLGKELTEKIKEKLGDDFGTVSKKISEIKIIPDDGTYIKKEGMIPKARLDEEIQKRKDSEEQIKKMTTDLEELKKLDPEKLQGRIAELEAEGKKLKEESQTKLKQMRIDNEIEKVFSSKENYVDLEYRDFLRDKIKTESITLSENLETVAGIVEQLPSLREKYPSFFGEKKALGTQFKTSGEQDAEFFTMEQIKERQKDQKWMNENLEKVEKSLAHHNKI